LPVVIREGAVGIQLTCLPLPHFYACQSQDMDFQCYMLWSLMCEVRCSWIYNYLCNQCLSLITLWLQIPLGRGVLDTTLCNKVCQWLATGRWVSLGTLVSFTKKTDRHDIAEITFNHYHDGPKICRNVFMSRYSYI
jgi:hypothetical protein